MWSKTSMGSYGSQLNLKAEYILFNKFNWTVLIQSYTQTQTRYRYRESCNSDEHRSRRFRRVSHKPTKLYKQNPDNIHWVTRWSLWTFLQWLQSDWSVPNDGLCFEFQLGAERCHQPSSDVQVNLMSQFESSLSHEYMRLSSLYFQLICIAGFYISLNMYLFRIWTTLEDTMRQSVWFLCLFGEYRNGTFLKATTATLSIHRYLLAITEGARSHSVQGICSIISKLEPRTEMWRNIYLKE
jgi:hypothetical protein